MSRNVQIRRRSFPSLLLLLSLYVAMATGDADGDDHHDEEKTAMSKFVYKPSSYVMPWTKGPNICAYYRYADGSTDDMTSRFYADCLITDPKPICGRGLKVEYECCEGFAKGQAGDAGCLRVSPLTDLSTTLRSLGVTALPVSEAGLSRTLRREGAFTAFIPTDSAVDAAPKTLYSALADRFDSLIKYHLYIGRLSTDGMKRNQRLVMVNGQSAVINRHCNGMLTINCARIVLPDRQATNGIIHLLDRVIVPLTGTTANLMSLLRAEPKFSRFLAYLMRDPALQEELTNRGPYTVFVPTNEALEKLPETVKQRLTEAGVLEALLKQHIVRRPVCATSVTADKEYSPLDGAPIVLGCGERHGDLLLNGKIKVTEIDHVTGNGVVHVIDDVILPESVMDAVTLAEKLGATEFVSLVDKAGLRQELNAMSDVTFFIPQNEAFHNLSSDLKTSLEDPDYVRQFLLYHVIKGKRHLADAVQGSQYTTSVGDKIAKLSVSMVRNADGEMKYSLQGAQLTRTDIQGGQYNMNLIDNLLIPPRMSLMEYMKSDPELSMFLSVFIRAGGTSLLRSTRGKFTLIVPNNHAWQHIEDDLVEEMADRRQLRRILRYHVWPEVLYSSSFKHNYSYYVKTLLGEDVSVKVDHDEMVLNSRVHVARADIPNLEGGVVHIVEEILRCRCPFRRRSFWRRVGR